MAGSTRVRTGICLMGETGSMAVYAAAAGEVVFARSEYPGLVVIIEHSDGLYSMYGHLDYALAVEAGQAVERGPLRFPAGVRAELINVRMTGGILRHRPRSRPSKLPGMVASARNSPLEISVNGRPHRVAASLDTPLLYVLRNELNLNSVRFGCGLSRCGACTVHVDGEPVRSCELPVCDVARREIVTLEGLGTPDNLHPLQQAFLDEQAAQCGYCIPGIIMTAAHLLEQNSRPTESDIRVALNECLCRCGAHVRIVRAVQRAVELSSSTREPA